MARVRDIPSSTSNGDHPGYGALRAIDPVTGDMKWDFRYVKQSWGGILTAASGLVFAGDEDGNFMAAAKIETPAVLYALANISIVW